MDLDLNVNAPEIQDLAVLNPDIVEGSPVQPNPAKAGVKDANIQIQKNLTKIEEKFKPGGNLKENIARNKHVVVGATINTNPQGMVIPKGKRVAGAVAVTSNGVTVLDGGAPVVQEVDNWSRFPCGSYNVDAGNRFSVRAGGGGVHMVSAGGASLMGETITRVGGVQTQVTGDSVYVTGSKNVSVESEGLLNLKSAKQVVVDGTLGVSSNVVIQGGMMAEGEVFVNHITAPREIQETLNGFTAEGAMATLMFGSWISGVAVLGGPTASALGSTAIGVEIDKLKAAQNLQFTGDSSPRGLAGAQYPYFPDYVYDKTALAGAGGGLYFTPSEVVNANTEGLPGVGQKVVPIKLFCGTQLNNAVMLRAHAHEFPNIPLTLTESSTDKKTSANTVVRTNARDFGINQNYPIPATPLQDGPKYDKKGSIGLMVARFVIDTTINVPGMDKTYSYIGVN